MEVFRITRGKYAKDMSGAGAGQAGGRWNEKGVAVIYTSASRPLAALEYLAHITSISVAPAHLVLVTYLIPDKARMKTVDISALPKEWDYFPYHATPVSIGTAWAEKAETLLLKVPSALMAGEYNIIINPKHPDISMVKFRKIEPFQYDDRLQTKG